MTAKMPAGRAVVEAFEAEGITTVFGIPGATSTIGGMVELVELTPAQLDRYTLFYVSSIGWDGTDPVRQG